MLKIFSVKNTNYKCSFILILAAAWQVINSDQ